MVVSDVEFIEGTFERLNHNRVPVAQVKDSAIAVAVDQAYLVLHIPKVDALAPARDPAALLDGLHRTPGDPDQKNLILSALVEAAQGDGPASDCALNMLLLALWPGLDAIRRRSIWRKIGSADEIEGAFDAARREADAYFGHPDIDVEGRRRDSGPAEAAVASLTPIEIGARNGLEVEVVEVRRDEGLFLRDALTGEERFVKERDQRLADRFGPDRLSRRAAGQFAGWLRWATAHSRDAA